MGRTRERTRLGNRKCRLLCPECKQLRIAYQHDLRDESDTVYFKDCPHSRVPYLLPQAEGMVGLLDVILNTPASLRLFPPARHQDYAIFSLGCSYVADNDVSKKEIRGEHDNKTNHRRGDRPNGAGN